MRNYSYAAMAGAALLSTGLALPLTLSGNSGDPGVDRSSTDQSLSDKAPASIGVIKTLHSNLNAGTTVKISDHGNVIDFLSPDSNSNGHYEHIGVGAVGEGYVLCYTGPGGTVNAFDVGESESGWGGATVVNSPFKITRPTSDNKISLAQTFKLNGQNRAVELTMLLKNLTASPILNVTLRRQVDFDVDTGGIDGWAGFQNFHANTTHTSVFAFNRAADAPPGTEAHAMSLSHFGPAATGPHFAFVTSAILETSCNGQPYETGTSSAVEFGDFGDTLLYNIGTLPANGSKSVTVQYARY